MKKYVKPEIISHYEMAAEEATYKAITAINELKRMKKKESRLKLLALMNEVVDFNSVLSLCEIMPFLIRDDAVRFLVKHKDELKSKMNISQVIEYSRMYNLTTAMKLKFETLSELKAQFTKIKPI